MSIDSTAYHVISKIINSIRTITKWPRVLREGKRKTDRGNLDRKLTSHWQS